MQLSCHLRRWLHNADGFALLVMLRAFQRYEADSGPCCAPVRAGRARFWPRWSARDGQPVNKASRANSCILHLRVQDRFFMDSWPLRIIDEMDCG